MGLIAPADQERLRQSFAEMTTRVRLVFFTQTLGCETCLHTRQILDELPPLSDKIAVEEANAILDRDRAAGYGIDRAPAIVVLAEDPAASTDAPAAERYRDTRIRFLGAPAGYEFVSLVEAVLHAGGVPSSLTDENRTRLAGLDEPVAIQVFTTPTCPHCPRAVTLAHEMALASPHVTAVAVEATEFPDLAQQYAVTGVPKTIVTRGGDITEILGALPQDDFIAQALASPDADGPFSG